MSVCIEVEVGLDNQSCPSSAPPMLLVLFPSVLAQAIDPEWHLLLQHTLHSNDLDPAIIACITSYIKLHQAIAEGGMLEEYMQACSVTAWH